MMQPLWLFYHVPKTGGQTVRDHLATQWRRGVDFEHLGKWDRPAALTVDDLAERSVEERARLRLVSGHPVSRALLPLFPGRSVREVIVIREPAKRTVSHYNFAMTMRQRRGQPIISLEEFVERQIGDNFMTRFISRRIGHESSTRVLDAVLFELSRFWLVTRTETLDRFLPLLFEDMGLPPVVPERSNVTGVTIDRFVDAEPMLLDELRARSPLDVMLFEAVPRLQNDYLERRRDRHSLVSTDELSPEWYSA